MFLIRQYLYPLIAVLALSLVTGLYVMGRNHGYAKRDLECTVEKTAYERANAELARKLQALREDTRAQADKLAADLIDAQKQLGSLKERINREIEARTSRLTRTFDERLTRMLNEITPVRVNGVPEASAPSAGAAPEAGAAASDRAGYSASQRSVATAMSQCRTEYASCANQVNSLIDWVKKVTE